MKTDCVLSYTIHPGKKNERNKDSSPFSGKVVLFRQRVESGTDKAFFFLNFNFLVLLCVLFYLFNLIFDAAFG